MNSSIVHDLVDFKGHFSYCITVSRKSGCDYWWTENNVHISLKMSEKITVQGRWHSRM